MGIREDMEVAFDEMLDGEHPERQALLESAIWSAKWAMERCAWFVARELKHPFIQHPERAYLAEAIRQLAKEMK